MANKSPTPVRRPEDLVGGPRAVAGAQVTPPSTASLLAYLERAYARGTQMHAAVGPVTARVLAACEHLAPPEPHSALGSFLRKHDYVFDRIVARWDRSALFREAAVLLAYYLAHTRPAQLLAVWPLPRESLALVFSDLGRAMDVN